MRWSLNARGLRNTKRNRPNGLEHLILGHYHCDRVVTKTINLYTMKAFHHFSLQQWLLPCKEGKVVERYIGRIPADAWDKVSDLL